MARRKVLIGGATGFIGRNLTQRLASHPDLEVHGIHHIRPPFTCPSVTWHKADLTNAQDVARIVPGMDIVVQAAATTSGARDIVERPHIHVTDNAVMNSLLLRAAHENHVQHFLFFSCVVMLPSSSTPLSEDAWDPARPLHPSYFGSGWTKLYIERMCEFYSRLGHTRHTVIRHSNIYGPFDKFDLDRSHVFGATVTKTMTAADGRIVVWGSGDEARDLLYIDDLVDFVELAIQRQAEPYRLYHCGYGQATSIKDLVQWIVRASGRQLAIEHDLNRPTIPTSLCLDCNRAKQELNWQPKVSLDEGIRRTLNWWREHHQPNTQNVRDRHVNNTSRG